MELHPIPLLLDTDIGNNIDDSLALAYLLRHSRCDLLGVTTVSGDVGKRAACAEVLWREVGRDDVPVHCGSAGPLLIGPGQSAVPLYPAVAHRAHRLDRPVGAAVEFMRSTIRSRPGEITLLTIGPLTNVALLFSLDPEVPSLLKEIVSMAGVHYPHERPIETNVLIDPIAAAIVFGATAQQGAAPHTLVGLNVTTRCTQTADEFRVRHRAAAPPAPAVLEMAEAYFRRRRQVTYNDPLAAAVVFAPDLCTFETGVVTMVVNAPGEDAAKTFFAPDRAAAGRERDGPSNHRVAKGVKVERFFDEYFNTLCGTLPADRL
jgi:inosine-uridine nucleoside N-ribohydrolase